MCVSVCLSTCTVHVHVCVCVCVCVCVLVGDAACCCHRKVNGHTNPYPCGQEEARMAAEVINTFITAPLPKS